MSDRAGDSGDRAGWRGYAQLAAVVVVVAAALYFARAPSYVGYDAASAARPAAAKPVVATIRPEPEERALTVRLTGAIETEARTRVASQATGRVVWVSPKFRNGGTIPANEVFVRIDPTEYELLVEAARRTVEKAEAGVLVETARADGNAETPAVAMAEAELERARAELRLAELRLSWTDISLPYDSRVLGSDIEVGELVGADEARDAAGRGASRREGRLGAVYRVGASQARAPIEPGDLEYLEPAVGRAATVRVGGREYAARVSRVSSTINPRTRLARVFLEFPDDVPAESRPKPGGFARIEIEGPAHKDVFALPEAAARDRDEVWVVRGGVLETAAPRTLGRAGGEWLVEAFDAGDGVVVGAPPVARAGLEVEAVAAGPSG